MTNQNYRHIEFLLGGLTARELADLRTLIDSKIGPDASNKRARLIGYEHGYVEIKKRPRGKSKATLPPLEYEYWRWWDGKSLRSEYIGKVGTFIRNSTPAQPRKAA